MDKKIHVWTFVFIAVFAVIAIVFSAIGYADWSKWCYSENGTIMQIGQQGQYICISRDGGILGSLTDWFYGRRP